MYYTVDVFNGIFSLKFTDVGNFISPKEREDINIGVRDPFLKGELPIDEAAMMLVKHAFPPERWSFREDSGRVAEIVQDILLVSRGDAGVKLFVTEEHPHDGGGSGRGYGIR